MCARILLCLIFIITCVRVRAVDGSHLITNTNSIGKEFRITVVTWNLFETQPSKKDCMFIKSLSTDSDLIVIGVQECENIKPRRHEGSRSRAWATLQSKMLGSKFELLCRHKLGGMQIAAYSRRCFTKQVKAIQSLDVTCGIGNVIANKGAVAILLRLKNYTLAFINAHLAAHENQANERNKNIKRIFNSLSSQTVPGWRKHVEQIESEGCFDSTTHKDTITMNHNEISPAFDATIFFGDLNYRLNLPRAKVMPKIVEIIKESKRFRKQHKYSPQEISQSVGSGNKACLSWEDLLKSDQLRNLLRNGRLLESFKEQPICFQPTFKFDVGSEIYDSSKKGRCPAWTDRILLHEYRSTVRKPILQLAEYNAVMACRHGDHRPVYGKFKLSML